MSYIVIEKFNVDFPSIVVEMETGMPLIFDNIEDAQIEADDCQDGQIMEI